MANVCREEPFYEGCFYYMNNPFCENGIAYSIISHHAVFEPANTCSNVFFFMAVAWFLSTSTATDPISRLGAMLLLCTGIGSAFYHATLWYACKIWDTFPMDMFILFMAMALSANQFKTKNLVYFLSIVFLVYQVMLLGLPLENTDGHHTYSPMASFQTILPLAVVFLAATASAYQNAEKNRRIVIHALLSFALAIGFHFLDNACPTTQLVPHVFWHLFAAYAALNLLVLHVRLETEVDILWYKNMLPMAKSSYSRL